jgi:hypothetical protein
MPAFTRRQYAGAAAATTITAGINPSDTTCSLAATTGWPSTAGVPFYVVIDPGTSAEEKCSATISGSTLTLTRAQDDTTATSHSSGATIYPVFTANDADEANEVVSKLTTKGDLLVTTGSALNRLAVGTNAHVLTADSAATNGVKWALSPETDLVTTKGDILVASAADTLARQGVGSNGQVLVADSGVTNGVAWVDPQTNRNVLDNGAMQVAQRGTSANFDSGAKPVTTDRWNVYNDIGAAGTISVENDAPTGSGFRKSMKVLYTAVSASPSGAIAGLIFQYIEGQNLQQFAKGTASAKPFAMSFWVKSNLTGTYIAQLRDRNNSRSVSASYTISASATWEKKTIIFPADTTGAFNNDNGGSLQVNFFQSLGTGYTSGTLQTTWGAYSDATTGAGQVNLAATINNYWQITGVQLEAGSVATPFEFENIGTTLAKCQRYYQRWTTTSAYGRFTLGANTSTTGGIYILQMPTTMRTGPTTTLEYSSIGIAEPGGGVIATTGLTIVTDSMMPLAVQLNGVVASGLTQYRPSQLIANNDGAAYIAVTAEL